MNRQPQRNCARRQSRNPSQMSDVSEQGSLAYESRLFFRNAFHFPRWIGPATSNARYAGEGAGKRNEVAGTMPDESPTARISGGEAAVNLPTR